MAVVTKQYLVEMVQSMLGGGRTSQAKKFEGAMIEAFLQQAVNKRLRTDYFTTTLPSGETLPSGLNLACYDAVPVEKYKNVARAKLPASPVSLMRNIGVFFVGPAIGDTGGGEPPVTNEVSYVIVEGVVGGIIRVLGTEDTVTGISDGSVTVTCDSFSGKYVRVVRGGLPVPGIDPGDGGLYFAKDTAANYITFSQPLSAGEYIMIDVFMPVIPVMPDWMVVESRVGVTVKQYGLQDAITGIVNGSTTVSSAAFSGRYVSVIRGSITLPDADPGNGGMYFTKILNSNDVVLSAPLVMDEYLKIETV